MEYTDTKGIEDGVKRETMGMKSLRSDQNRDDLKIDAEDIARKNLEKSTKSITPKDKAQIEKDLGGDLASVAGEHLNQLAYKSMNPAIYVVTTIGLYAVEIYLAIVVNDIGNVFGFIGTIAGTSLSFFIPSVLFCQGIKLFASERFKKRNSGLYTVSIVNFVIGIFFFGLFLYSNILSLQG
jgi:F0F1-type ATP synthase assembly protein I